MPIPTEVFLSHSSVDLQFADRIAEILEGHGIPFWYSKRDIIGAREWHDEIGAALGRCDWFALILSPASAEAMWVKRELLYALRQPPYAGHIVVIDYQPADPDKLSWALPDFQWVDFQHGFDDGCRALLRIWGRGYKGRTEKT